MAHSDRSPDADASPLTSEERAAFDALAAQVGASDRTRARVRAVSATNPVTLGVLSLVATFILIVAVAVLAPVSLWVAGGCWMLLVYVCMRSLPRWRALGSGIVARFRTILNGP